MSINKMSRVWCFLFSSIAIGFTAQAMKLPEPMIKTVECDEHHDAFITAVEKNLKSIVFMVLDDSEVVEQLSVFDKLYALGRAVKNKNQEILCKMLNTPGYMSSRSKEMCSVMSWAFEEIVKNGLSDVIKCMKSNVEFMGGVCKESKQRVIVLLQKRKEQREQEGEELEGEE